MEGSGVGNGGGWAARGRLNHPLGLCGLAMCPRTASHRPNMFRTPKKHITTTGQF